MIPVIEKMKGNGGQLESASPTEPASRSSREARAKVGSSGWIRASNPPVNRRKTTVLPRVASDCIESPDRELTPETLASLDDPNNRSDAADCGLNPGLDVSKGQEKDKVP